MTFGAGFCTEMNLLLIQMLYIVNLQIHIFARSTGAEYALKVIDKSKCHGKEHMIESEVSILRRVHHPNIIQLVAEYDTHSELYLVMELIKVGGRSQLHCKQYWLSM
jgi:serine/threonine protein kinase